MNARSRLVVMPVGTVQIIGKRQGKQEFQRFNIVYRRISGGPGLLLTPVSFFTLKIVLFPTVSKNFKDMCGGPLVAQAFQVMFDLIG